MARKQLRMEDMDFDELVSQYTGLVLKGLLRGTFENAVYTAMSAAIEWSKRTEEKKARAK